MSVHYKGMRGLLYAGTYSEPRGAMREDVIAQIQYVLISTMTSFNPLTTLGSSRSRPMSEGFLLLW